MSVLRLPDGVLVIGEDGVSIKIRQERVVKTVEEVLYAYIKNEEGAPFMSAQEPVPKKREPKGLPLIGRWP